MLERGVMVTYREISLQVGGFCGLVEGIVQDQPDHAWVRWVGDTIKSKEYIPDLEVVS